MNKLNTQLLKNAFPTVYTENFFFEHGDGWFDLVAKAGAFISSKTSDCYVVQSKEKFGKLRIYIECKTDADGLQIVDDRLVDEIYSFLTSLQNDSTNICEGCGINLTVANRNPQNGYWISNICISCSKKTNERKF